MCGIAGIFRTRAGTPQVKDAHIRSMTDTLVHRGPDDGGVWCDKRAGVALGNRRLAIIDLSAAGHQPMTSSCGRFVLAYNGEVYNADELRVELVEKTGREFRGHSDTEVIAEACAVWGAAPALKRLIGMFALALWDKREKRLLLARDRLGIKPLFWSFRDGLLLFGSELKALKAHPAFVASVDRNAVASYLRHTYVPAPHSIYQDVRKLEPGKLLTLRHDGEPVIETYWSLDDVVQAGLSGMFSGDEREACDHLADLLGDAVSRRMISDVPLGAFLSGGIDSSTVVALMQANSSAPVRTYSIGFSREGFNEAHGAAAIARHLRTAHTELYATPEEACDVIPSLPEYYDEPFADSSQIPTFLVSRLTKQHVTVALSGDGGDELFGGYTRYFMADKYDWPLFESPCVLRCSTAKAIRVLPPATWNRLAKVVPGRLRPALVGEKLHKLADCIGVGRERFYQRLISHWNSPEQLMPDAKEYRTIAWDESLQTRIPDFVSRMQYVDTATYLPDDILTKVDRASMAVSLEVRVPMLDHRVVEFAWSLPRAFKVGGGRGKRILRKVLARHVPDDLIKRQKMGFAVPIDEWLRGPLKEWASDLLSPSALKRNGFVEPEPVQRVWAEHLSGARSRPLPLWSVLMLQSWADAQRAGR
ncbi:MAG: asparagine synthase (glutamine-hydrolyzing) [Hyphomicrobiaceae bacterium]|nr:asparagine synthase (glutamine-hydrolyzing) [Hyphomicrobiaceae bacterium]